MCGEMQKISPGFLLAHNIQKHQKLSRIILFSSYVKLLQLTICMKNYYIWLFSCKTITFDYLHVNYYNCLFACKTITFDYLCIKLLQLIICM